MKGLYRRGDVWWLRFTPVALSPQQRISLETSDEADAIRKARRILDDAKLIRERALESGEASAAEVAVLVDRYAAFRAKEGLSPRTLEQIGLVLGGFAAVAIPPSGLAGLTRSRVNAWFDGRSLENPRTAIAYLRIVRRWLTWCVERGHLRINPAEGIMTPKVRQKIRRRFLSAADARLILDHAGKLDPSGTMLFVCYCALHSGLRKGEIIEARPDWFDLDAGLLHVQATDTFQVKDRDNRTIPLTKDFASWLRTWPMPGPWCIAPAARAGKHRYRWDFTRRWDKIVLASGITDLTFHDLRRTFASLHVSAGTSIYKVAKWLGDSVAVVEQHYGHLIPQDDEINKAWE